MATFEKRKHGWLARVQKLGVRESKTFDLKKEAIAWAEQKEEGFVALIHKCLSARRPRQGGTYPLLIGQRVFYLNSNRMKVWKWSNFTQVTAGVT